jgi:hypothetical protein
MAAVLPDQHYRPRLNPSVELVDVEGLGLLLRDTQSSRSCRIGKSASHLIPWLDGEHSPADLQAQLQTVLGRSVPLDMVTTFIATLGQQGMLMDDQGAFGALPASTRMGRAAANILHIRIPLFQGQALMIALTAALRRIPSGIRRMVLTVLLLNGVIAPLLVIGWELGKLEFNLATLPLSSIAITLHELGHSITLTLLGGTVRDFGVGIHYFLIPYAYTNTTDAYRLGQKDRILVSLGGPMVDLIFLGINGLILYFLPAGSTAMTIILLLIAYETSILIWNFNPFLPFDGYYILADVFNEPALRREGFRYLLSLPAYVLRRKPNQHSRRQRTIYLGYGVLSAMYMIGFITYGVALALAAIPS